MKIGFLLVVFLAFFGIMPAQELPRRAVLGFDVASLNSDSEKSAETGVVVKSLVSPTEAGGIHVGDVVSAVAGQQVSRPEEVLAILRKVRPGEQVSIELRRNGHPLEVQVSAQPAPYESSPNVDVLYRAVEANGSLRRVIVTKPKANGVFPAILLVGGLGCYSVDGLTDKDVPYGQIVYTLTREGYVVMRVEKTGEGDSQGPPCSAPESDLKIEAAGYAAGLKALRAYDFVDRDRIFILAHSIGPLVAVLVAQQGGVRGMIAAETIGRAWFDYQIEIARQQPLDIGEAYDVIERQARRNEVCLHYFYVEKETPESLLKRDAGCRDILVPGVPYTYLQQVADLDLAAQWRKLDMPVLVIYGTSDGATSANESHYLVSMINSFHPGRATYVEIPGMAHILNTSPSRGQFLRDHGGPHPQLHPAILPTLENWLRKQVAVGKG